VNPLLRDLVRAWRLAETLVLKPILARIGLADRPRCRGLDRADAEGGLHRPTDEGGRRALTAGDWQQGGLMHDREPAVLWPVSQRPPPRGGTPSRANYSHHGAANADHSFLSYR
jgi:hypothetical protein